MRTVLAPVFVLVSAFLLALGASAPHANAQNADDYPNRTIRLVVSVPPGGGVDTVARIVADGLQRKFGQTVFVENRGGVAGNLVTLFEGSIDDVFKTIVVNGYSRTAEEAADAGGVATLIKAGYDPGAMGAMLKKMLAKEKGASGGIFKTHPPTSERLAKVEAAGGKEKAAAPAEAKRTQRFKKVVKG